MWRKFLLSNVKLKLQNQACQTKDQQKDWKEK